MRSVEYNDNCKEVLPKGGVDVVAFDRIMVDPDKMGARLLPGLAHLRGDGGRDGS